MEITRDEMSEELRVLYVAMTRAKQKLIMLATPRQGAQKYIGNIAQKLSGQRKISPFVVRSAISLSDWMTMCALLHPTASRCASTRAFKLTLSRRSSFRHSTVV